MAVGLKHLSLTTQGEGGGENGNSHQLSNPVECDQ